uniref:uncharacterized protein isoform X4 n=1 Tax=Myxine glutinosa TaxID=7769 RepID=UPI0035901F30
MAIYMSSDATTDGEEVDVRSSSKFEDSMKGVCFMHVLNKQSKVIPFKEKSARKFRECALEWIQLKGSYERSSSIMQGIMPGVIITFVTSQQSNEQSQNAERKKKLKRFKKKVQMHFPMMNHLTKCQSDCFSLTQVMVNGHQLTNTLIKGMEMS